MQMVLVFGDSIVTGLWDERGGWPERLWKGHSRIVYNLGVDGNTSDDVSNRFNSEAKTRGANKNSVVIFAVGVNDSSRMNHDNRVEITKYTRNMEELIDRTRNQFTQKILCVGLAPIDQSKTVPFILERTVSFFSADRHDYDSELETVCHRKGVAYIPLKNLALENHLSEDGVHPLSSGHAIIAEKVDGAISQLA